VNVGDLKTVLAGAGVDVSSFRVREGRVPIGLLTSSGEVALPLWRSLRDLIKTTGHWPVVLGTDESLQLIGEQIDEKQGQVAPADLETFRKDRREEMERGRAEFRAEAPLFTRLAFAAYKAWRTTVLHLQTLGGTADGEVYDTTGDLRGRTHARVHIALVPSTNSWEVPRLLQFGGWNECPHPSVHEIILRDWEQRFGAELVCMQRDRLEFRVARPPRSYVAARALAREQYEYCEDLVDQGFQSVGALGAALRVSRTWFFWWD
jgi:hypothetical protein